MPGDNRGGRDVKRYKRPSDWLHEDIKPRVFDHIPAILRDYEWRRIGDRWEGVGRKGSANYEAMKRDFDARPERVHIKESAPLYVRIHGKSESYRLIDLINGGLSPHGREFVDVVKSLGEAVGVVVPDAMESPEAEAKRQERELTENRLDAVFEWCHEALKADTPAAAAARDYLRGRGIDEAAIDELGVGLYWSEAELSSRVVGQFGGKWANRWMEGRVVFPWRTAYGDPSQLWGRRLDDDPNRKWAGLSEREDALPGVTRGGPLYLDRARTVARSQGLILVEGVLDAAVAQSRNDRRVVAIGGAAMRQSGAWLPAIRELRPARVFVCLDPDEAGDKGAGPVLEALLGAGLEAWACPRLPDKLDPDELILRHGLEAWNRLVSASDPAIVRLVDEASRDIHSESPDTERLAAVKRVDALFGRLVKAGSDEGLFVGQAAKMLATRTGYDPEALEEKLAAAEDRAREELEAAEARSVADQLLAGLRKGEKPPRELIDKAQAALADLRPASGSDEGPPPEYDVEAILDEIRRLPPAIRTGWATLDSDDKLGTQFRPGELALVGARTGHGKTTFLSNLFWRWAAAKDRDGRPLNTTEGRLVFVTTEEPRPSIFARLMALAAAEADAKRVWPYMALMEWVRDPTSHSRWPWGAGGEKAVEDVLDTMRGLKGRVDIVWRPNWHAGDIAEFCRRVRDEHGLVAVVVDYLQRLRPMPNAGASKRAAERRDIEVSLLARELKALAVDLAVPVVCGAQVNRASISKRDGAREELARAVEHAEESGDVDAIPEKVMDILAANRPDLHHLREGGAEQEADMVLGLMNYGADWRKALKKADGVNRPDGSKPLPLGVGALKNRYGAVGEWADMLWWAKSGRIGDEAPKSGGRAVEFTL